MRLFLLRAENVEIMNIVYYELDGIIILDKTEHRRTSLNDCNCDACVVHIY